MWDKIKRKEIKCEIFDVETKNKIVYPKKKRS